jgi:hypothetical protein
MTNVEEIFKKSIDNQENYNIKQLKSIFESQNFYFDDQDDEWCEYLWYVIGVAEEFCCPQPPEDVYAYISTQFPVALIFDNCPEIVKNILSENNIFYTEFDFNLSCEENTLKKFIPDKRVIDESFLDTCDYSIDDERFEYVLERLETGKKYYIDPTEFTFNDILY